MSIAVGDTLGPYCILAPIGVGGMGEVWKARDTRLDRIVALKVLKAAFNERFECEARTIARLNHPHVCHLHDVGPNYLVMEYVEGTPLKGPLPLPKVIEYAGQILDALDAAHRKGITHRDVKPANILVTKQGIKLLDFGLAKLQTAPFSESKSTLKQGATAEGKIVGTLQYMSPEQLQGKEADARSDLFSFGCVLYEMLTGRRAFEGVSSATVIAAILEKDPRPSHVAPAVDRVLRRSLAKDPDERFQNARDLKTALFWALEQPSLPRSTRRSVGLWWLAATGIVGALAALAVTQFHRTAEESVLRFHIEPPEGERSFIDSGESGIALSPDGKTAVFVASVNGKTGLWARSLDNTAARLLAGLNTSVSAVFPFWSPDGKSIAFFEGAKLQRIDLSSGAPIMICNCSGSNGAWNSEGRIIFGSERGLFQVPAAGGVPSPLTTLDGSRSEIAHLFPQVIPGGRFLYLARSRKVENSGIYAAPFDKPAERARLLTSETSALYAPTPGGQDYLLWLRGATLVAQEFDATALKLRGDPRTVAEPVGSTFSIGASFTMNASVSTNGRLLYSVPTDSLIRLTWFDRMGKPLGVIGDPGAYAARFRLSPDGRRVAFGLGSAGDTDLWLLQNQRGVATRFTFTGGSQPVWCPDGKTIVFRSGENLFRKEVNGTGSEQRLTKSPNQQNPTDWSHDGRFVLYHEAAPETGSDLWVLPMKDNSKEASKPWPYIRTPFNEVGGHFSPEVNPHWVAYYSDESGQPEVYIQAFPESRAKRRISTSGGRFAQWGANGRELFYLSLDNKLMAVSLKAGPDGVEASLPHELFALPLYGTAAPPYDVSLDGQRFLVRVPGEPARLTMVVNWPTLMKKRAIGQPTR